MEKLAEREGLLGRYAASSLADARDHRCFAPVTGFASRSRRTRMIIDLGFESLQRGSKNLAEREESMPSLKVLFYIGFFEAMNIRTIMIRQEKPGWKRYETSRVTGDAARPRGLPV